MKVIVGRESLRVLGWVWGREQSRNRLCSEPHQFTQPPLWGDKGSFAERRFWPTSSKGICGCFWPAQPKEYVSSLVRCFPAPAMATAAVGFSLSLAQI